MFLVLSSGNLEIGHKVQNLQTEKAKTKNTQVILSTTTASLDLSPAGRIRAVLRICWIART